MYTNRLFYLLIVVILMVTACTPQVAMTPAATSAPPATPAENKPVTLRLAVADEEGRPSDPYVHEFIEQAKKLSKGNITIEPIWDAGTTTDAGFELGVIQLVKGGQADIGLSASRAFDSENITSFEALQAPFLIDNDALAIAVAQSNIASRMLKSLSSAGVVGLTLWPEDLRHPFSIIPNKPLLSPDDFGGLNIRTTPSGVSNMLVDALGGKPMSGDGDYEGAESGLRQGFSLTGTPTATGNVTFFAKYQVLFANSTAFEKLTETQQAILRKAAAATQTKAITEHPSEVEAATAWCADGGTIVMASIEQVAAFEAAAQPVFDKLEQDPLNAELIAAIRELKTDTKPAPGAEACTPAVGKASPEPSPDPKAWSEGLPPNGVWQVELSADDFVQRGVLKSTAADMEGVYTLKFQDGKGEIDVQGAGLAVSCLLDVTVVGGAVRLQNVGSATCDGSAYDDVQWRLAADGLHFHLVSTQAVELKTMYESKPWQKVADQ